MDKVGVKWAVAQRRAMYRAQKACDEQNLPYPEELIEFLKNVRKYSGC